MKVEKKKFYTFKLNAKTFDIYQVNIMVRINLKNIKIYIMQNLIKNEKTKAADKTGHLKKLASSCKLVIRFFY